jgi:ubiquitin-protein ligase
MPPKAPASGAAGLLARQLKGIQQAKDLPGISCGLLNDNVFEWEVMLMISDDCKYYGGTYPSPPSPPLQIKQKANAWFCCT